METGCTGLFEWMVRCTVSTAVAWSVGWGAPECTVSAGLPRQPAHAPVWRRSNAGSTLTVAAPAFAESDDVTRPNVLAYASRKPGLASLREKTARQERGVRRRLGLSGAVMVTLGFKIRTAMIDLAALGIWRPQTELG